MKITGFKKEGRRNPKIAVLLDDEPWVTLDPETVVRERLRSGQELTPARRDEILAADEVIRARQAAAGHAAQTPKTRLELEHFLCERRFSEPAIRKALATLSASGAVNDERVAGQVIQSRRRRKNVGPKRLAAELRKRGIPQDQAEDKVSEALEGTDLAAECLELARHYAKKYEPLDQPAQRRKLAAFLLRRGYAPEHVETAMDQLRLSDSFPRDQEI
jgi:regulatory protein